MSDQHHPAFHPEREALRERDHVRIITDKEEGWNISRLPQGVYGFTGSPSTEELPLFVKPVFQCFEIHKLVGGEICFVGYISGLEHLRLQQGSEPVSIDLYPEPYGESAKLISIPKSRVDRCRPPARERGNPMKLDIAPRSEFLGVNAN